MKKVLYIFLLLAGSIAAEAQEFRILKGGVTDSLPVAGNPEITYSLFTPSEYSSEKQWPVIFIFDPAGRGKSSVNLFRAAAEDQDYILASINLDLESKPLDSIIKTATAMANTIISTFPVDRSRIYTAGMGEGAQIGSALPLLFKNIGGIMAIGNSFVNPSHVNKENPYMFIGIAGIRDYMVYEMESYLKFYDNLDFPTEVYYFNGKENQWPESSVITNAVAGFTLQSIRDGSIPKDVKLIEKLFQNELAYVQEMRKSNQLYSSVEHLKRMEEKYEDFGFEDEIERTIKAVKKTDGYNSQRRDFKRAIAVEKEQQAEYEYLLRADIMTSNFQNIGWWAYQVDELKKLKESDNEARVNMAFRLHGYLDFITKREFDLIQKSDLPVDNKIFISVLRTAVNQEDPEAYLKIISLSAKDGDYPTALLYLEDLLKTGYKDFEKLYDIPGALDLQFSEEYNEVVKKYLGKSKFYNEQPK
ncbi:hypothetical protein [Christiangramia aquimixticola]|uniref:hypothetical protein n=1 Tax=Christiangramia aquimixticola TaxID=1697558 RepID=UPI003AA915A8